MNFGFGFMSSAPAEPDTSANSTPALETYATRGEIDLKAFGEANIQVLLQRDSGEDGVTTWTIVSETEDEKIWRATVDGSDWSPFRVKKAVFADKHTIEAALLDVDVLLKLDDMTERMIILDQADKEGRITLRHMASKGVFPIAPREFIMVTYATELPDGRLAIASRSVGLDDVEPFEGHVRARNVITGYIIDEKTDADGAVYCEVTLLAHADLAGYIPSSVVNMLGTSATVKVLDNLKAYVEK